MAHIREYVRSIVRRQAGRDVSKRQRADGRPATRPVKRYQGTGAPMARENRLGYTRRIHGELAGLRSEK